MKSGLEQFVRDHREEFDNEEPDGKIWEKIHRDLDPGKKKRVAPIRTLSIRLAAAAVILVALGAGWYFISRPSGGSSSLAGNRPTVQAPPKGHSNGGGTGPGKTS